jgi:tetratricopeptide (TPR) repeat protein
MPLPKLNKYVRNYEEVLREHPDNSDVNRSIAFVYLKLKNYEKAREYFERAMEDDFDDAENYFYAAVTILKGKKAFMTSRDDINKAEEYIQAAISIEPRGIFYYFWAYIRYDHHARKFYKVTPSYTELVEEAFNEGVSDSDIEELFEILGQSRPEQLPLNG